MKNMTSRRHYRNNNSRKLRRKKQKSILPPKVKIFFSNMWKGFKKTYLHQFKFIKKNRKFSIILVTLSFVILLTIGGVLYKKFKSVTNTSDQSSAYSLLSPGQSGATNNSINHLFKSDDLQLKIRSYMDKVSELSVKNDFLSEKGQFVIIKADVYNSADTSKIFLLNKQKISTKKDDYFCSLSATYILADDKVTYNSEISPHGKMQVSLVFDIPANESPTELDFYGSINSKPTKIPLG